MTTEDLNKAIEYLRECLLRYEPENLVANRINSIQDIYKYRIALKKIDSNITTIDVISNLILEAIHHNRRFTTYIPHF